MKLLRELSKRVLCAFFGAALTIGLIAFWIITSSPARAGGDDLLINQRNAADTGTIQRVVTHPPGVPSVLFYDQSTLLPVLIPLGTGFSVNAGVLEASGGAASWASITGKPTTLAGYGITDAYPLTGNPSGFLTGITSGQVTAALGLSPIDQAGARSAISLTTTGAGTATYNSTTGVLNIPTPPAAVSVSINDAPGRSLVSSTAATGFQISSTRPARVCYEGVFSTTSTIGGPASASVFLETSTTNSTTPSDWTTRAQQTYTNSITLAVVLNQVQSNNWAFCRDIRVAEYVRIRSGSITGTASVSLNSAQQETTY